MNEGVDEESYDTSVKEFINRADEVRILDDAIDDLQRDGQGSVIIISGDAGVGKTYLVHHIKNTSKTDDINWLDCICLAGDSEPFQPLKDCFSSYIEKKRNSYTNLPISMRMAQKDDDLGDVESIFDKDEGPTIQRAMEFIDKLTGNTSLVIYIDDLHLADSDTLLFIRYIAANIVDMNMLMICALRPEYIGDNDLLRETLNFVYHRKQHIFINMNNFEKEQTRKLVETNLEEIPPDYFIDIMHESTGGNPLFIVETLRSMLSNKVIDPSKGEYIDSEEYIVWPSTVRYTVERKVNNLNKDTKRFLEYVSILESRFSFNYLSEYVNMDDMDLLDVIDDLIDRNILEETNKPEWYIFTCKAIKDIVMDSLGPSKAKLLNKRAVEVIEICYKEELDEHHEEMGIYLERTGDISRAIDHFHKAACYREKKGEIERAIKDHLKVNELIDRDEKGHMRSEEFCKNAGTLLFERGKELESNDDKTGRELIRKAIDLFEKANNQEIKKKCEEYIEALS